MTPFVPNPLDERQFVIAIQSLADTITFGNDPSPFRGPGGEYVQSRPYQDGDPVRSIDWRVTARTGRPHVREHESLKHKPVCVVVDQSRSMFARSVKPSKWDWTLMLASALALASIRRSSPVCLFGTGRVSPVLRTPPSLSRDAVLRWTTLLRQSSIAEKASIAETLHDFDAATREKCLLLVLSDVHEADAVDALKRAAARHEVVVLRPQDPAERMPPARGFFRGTPAESVDSFFTRPHAALADFQKQADSLRQAGVGILTLPTETNFVPVLRDFLKTRGRSV